MKNGDAGSGKLGQKSGFCSEIWKCGSEITFSTDFKADPRSSEKPKKLTN